MKVGLSTAQGTEVVTTHLVYALKPNATLADIRSRKARHVPKGTKATIARVVDRNVWLIRFDDGRMGRVHPEMVKLSGGSNE